MQGCYANRAPFGYVNSKDERDKSILIVDSGKAEVVRRVFSEYTSGLPIYLKAKTKRAPLYRGALCSFGINPFVPRTGFEPVIPP